MNFAQENKAGSRTTAFVGVVLLHILVIWAIASGLAKKVVEKVAGPIETKVIEEIKPPPPPPEKLVPPPPDLKAPPPPFVPIPEVQVQTPPPPTAVTVQSTTPPPVTEFKPAPPPAPAAVPAPPAPPAKGSVSSLGCTVVRPEMPSLNYEGVAEFVVSGTVRGGKVVQPIEIRVKRGIPDRRGQRALLGAIEQALTQYKCASDGTFEQEFVFKIE